MIMLHTQIQQLWLTSQQLITFTLILNLYSVALTATVCEIDHHKPICKLVFHSNSW